MFSPPAYVRTSTLSATSASSSSGNTSNGGNRPRKSAVSRVFTGSTLRGVFLFSPCTDSLVLSRWPPWSHRPQGGCMSVSPEELDYAGGGLKQETNWWGAFVIGLAGTILVTGIAPVMVTTLGAASIPVIIVITITGYLLCLILAELSAMMPDRSGGLPAYAYPAYKDRWPRFAEHVNGFTAWAYWLGWFPVAPLNMILASAYIADRLKLTG